MSQKQNPYSIGKTEEKRPLRRPRSRWVDNIVTCISVAREQLGKHVPAKTNSWPTIGKVFPILGNEILNTQQ
jgi:hypothetical protein